MRHHLYLHPTIAIILVLGFTLPSTLVGQKVDVPKNLQLENELHKAAIQILDKLREQGDKIRNVGVLKFAVIHQGAVQVPRSLGHFNRRLTEKMELALVWASPKSKKGLAREMGVLMNATEIGKEVNQVHINHEAREKYFDVKCPLYWQNEKKEDSAKPDALVFGFAEISDDLKSIRVELSVFSKTDPKSEIKISPFQAPLDLDDLLDCGLGFNSKGKPGVPKVVKFHKPRTHPLDKGPLKLEIFYGDEVGGKEKTVNWDKAPQPMTATYQSDTGCSEMVIPEPKTNRRMKLVVSRRNLADSKKYGVLLRVNGLNTLYSQSLPDENCSLWVMNSDCRKCQIFGFQKTIGRQGEVDPFKSFNGKKAEELKRFYGSDTGLISMTLFEEIDQKQERPIHIDRLAAARKRTELHSINSSIQPKQPLRNRSTLTAKYRALLFPTSPKGILGPGETEHGATQDAVEFERNPVPIFSGSLRYFHLGLNTTNNQGS